MASKNIKGLAKSFMLWVSHTPSLKQLRNYVDGIIEAYTIENGRLILSYNDDYRKRILEKIRVIFKETGFLLNYDEAYRIFMAVKNTQKIRGDIAEIGVYTGGSAKIICEAKGDKALYLFDTFKGLPKIDSIDSKNVDYLNFFEREFQSPLSRVKNLLKDYKNVHFYPGFFPDTAEPVKELCFSFVHMDVDIYRSTLNCLIFFYPRMSKGGVIMSHDYITSKGVRKAFDDFFKDKSEPIIEISTSQCIVTKN